jgi:hypothetical protein
VLMIACSEDEPRSGTDLEDITWEEFVARSYRVEGEREFYLVEWDLQFSSLGGLRRYYDESIDADDGFRSIVHHYPAGVRDIWDQQTQLELTYCIHSNFEADFDRAVSEMDEAARAWERVANVDFEYLPDAMCSPDSYPGIFTVKANTNGTTWCSTFPSDPEPDCLDQARTIGVNFLSADTNPPWTSQMTLRHELGHQMGLRHEFIHGSCPLGNQEDPNFEELTELDTQSVMTYPGLCSEDVTLDISELDGVGLRELYGMPAAWYVAIGVI